MGGAVQDQGDAVQGAEGGIEQVEETGLADLGGLFGVAEGQGCVGGADRHGGQDGGGEQFFHLKTPVGNSIKFLATGTASDCLLLLSKMHARYGVGYENQ